MCSTFRSFECTVTKQQIHSLVGLHVYLRPSEAKMPSGDWIDVGTLVMTAERSWKPVVFALARDVLILLSSRCRVHFVKIKMSCGM